MRRPVLERMLVVWCPGLLEEREDGRGTRTFTQVVEVAGSFSPAASPVRPGVCALPTRGPSRYFGGDERLARLVADALAGIDGPAGTAGIDGTAGRARIGVADGLFPAVLAAQAAQEGPVVVPPGKSAAFLAPWPVETLDQPELVDLLRRLGIRTLGDFAALPARHVLGRLGTVGVVCHELAGATRSEPPGYRVAPRGQPREASASQAGFWGEAAESEARAERVLWRLQQLVHPEGIVVGRLRGGRGPDERARLVPWAGRTLEPGPTGSSGGEPWPGRLPSPAPAVLFEQPLPASLVGSDGAEVEVTASGLTSAAPCRLSVAGGPWQGARAWAGPWPSDERWWSVRRRRRARMQFVTETGRAYLLVREGAGWWVEGAYD